MQLSFEWRFRILEPLGAMIDASVYFGEPYSESCFSVHPLTTQRSFIMPKAKAVASLSGLIDTEMEDETLEADAFPTPDSNQENAPPKKKGGRGNPTTKRFTKPQTRRSGDSVAPRKSAPKAKPGRKRAQLKEQTNVQEAEDTEEVDEFDAQVNEDTAMDELVASKQPTKRKAPPKKAGRPPKKAAVSQANGPKKDGEFEYTPTAVRQTKGIEKVPGRQAAKPTANKRQASRETQQHERIVPETQVPLEADTSETFDSNENDEDAVPQSVFPKANGARNTVRQRQAPGDRRRAGSASDAERSNNDPMTRRKLGEMTRKFESLDMKYKTLKEVGIKEVEARHAEYKAQSQSRAKGMIICLILSDTR